VDATIGGDTAPDFNVHGGIPASTHSADGTQTANEMVVPWETLNFADDINYSHNHLLGFTELFQDILMENTNVLPIAIALGFLKDDTSMVASAPIWGQSSTMPQTASTKTNRRRIRVPPTTTCSGTGQLVEDSVDHPHCGTMAPKSLHKR